jgi:hypothetical protein
MGKKMKTKSIIIIKIITETKIIKNIKIKIKNINNRMYVMSRASIIEKRKITNHPEKMMKIQNLEMVVIKFNLKIYFKKMRLKMKILKIFKNREVIEIKNKTFKKILIKIISVDPTTKNNKNFKPTTIFISPKVKNYLRK